MVGNDHEKGAEEVTEGFSLQVPFEIVTRLHIFVSFLALSPGNHDHGAKESCTHSEEESTHEGAGHEITVIGDIGH